MHLASSLLLAAAAMLAGCAPMDQARSAVERTGTQLGQKVDHADAKVSRPLQKSRTQQVIDNTGARIDRAVDHTLKRN